MTDHAGGALEHGPHVPPTAGSYVWACIAVGGVLCSFLAMMVNF